MSKDDPNHRQWLDIPARGQHAQTHAAGTGANSEPPQTNEQPPADAQYRQQTAPIPQVEQISEPAAQHAHATANIARSQVENAYEAEPPHQTITPLTEAEPTQIPNAYDRHYHTAEATPYDWRQYHVAWQDYYQQYYHRYYTQQLHSHRQRQLEERAASAAAPVVSASNHLIGKEEEPTPVPQKARNELLAKIGERTKKLRNSSHFMPIATALCVGLIFFGLQFNKVIAAQVNAYVSPSRTISDNVIIDPNASPVVSKEPRLIIPKINVDVPIVLGLKSLDNDATQVALQDGVVHYPIPGANSLPGQTGNNVILGHSSNDVFAPGDYKFAFVLLERLEVDDVFYINYESKRYVYRVSGKEVINPDQVEKLIKPNDKPMTTLVTCVPIGTNKQRLLVYSEQISPDPAKAQKINPANPSNGDEVTIPGSLASPLERFFGI